MTEEFLYYIWKFKRFESLPKLINGELLQVISAGELNRNSGPDFFNARLKIGSTIWAGNVEIHIRSSDWYNHNHEKDDAYDSIILHVVHEYDKPVFRKNGEEIQCFELKGKYNETIFGTYLELIKNQSSVPCHEMIHLANRFQVNHWLDRMAIERMESKFNDIKEKLAYNNDDWSETFYQALARNYGFKVNAIPFEMLARSLPIKLLAKHKDNLLQVEALLFGQAGMLQVKNHSDYFLALQKEYNFLAKKYNLQPIDSHLWRFMRLRPPNFPTLRISQFASLVTNSSFLFSKILEIEKLSEFYPLFDVQASGYWNEHFTFSTKSKKQEKKMGKSAVNLLLINTILPFIFIYGQIKDRPKLIDRSLKMLEQIPGEHNSVISKWETLGVGVRTAFNTQALIHLKDNYCNNKRCLECEIGNDLLHHLPQNV